ncbi:MAG: efflux RND transporter periplasmic adaptor subunit, partial [Gammaproteobacteria bacterium]|nr:efflux RND transporter periplasmic adaptor subunit [Gammaproteobacteria bacterium]
IIKLPEDALIRAGTDGIITRVLVDDGIPVEPGTVILKLENLELSTRRNILLAKLEEFRARQKDIILQDRTQAEIIKFKIDSIEAELEDVKAQLNSLDITSMTRGLVFLPQASDLPGKYVKRGEVIGYIADLRQVSARVVIPQSRIDAVRHETQVISARLRSRPDEIITAQFLRVLPQATDRLPSRLLGSGAGGEVAVDFRDETGMQAISNIFEVEISLPIRNSGNYLGQRIYVRFSHQRESIGNQLLRKLKQLTLQAPFV